MLSLLILSSVVGGFSYTVDTSRSRSKSAATAPEGYAPTYTETIRIVVATAPADGALNVFLADAAESMRADAYDGEPGSEGGSFETTNAAGWLEVDERVLAASPDVVSLDIGAGSYQAGMAHPQPQADEHVLWSRRLNRPLRQAEVLAMAPDRKLRRLALARYDNLDGIEAANFPDGLPLDWSDASVGPNGITWWFGPYALGGYPSGGSTTIPWDALKPYLRKPLPFAIDTLRTAARDAG